MPAREMRVSVYEDEDEDEDVPELIGENVINRQGQAPALQGWAQRFWPPDRY